MNTSEVLNRAADLIEERGWVQIGDGRGVACDPGGTCAQVAITKSAGFKNSPAVTAFVAYLGGRNIGAIWRWNDSPERTKSQVIEALRACAVIEAARETATERETAAVLA